MPRQMPSYDIAVRWRGWCKLMHGPRRAELAFDAMTWWMAKLERGEVSASCVILSAGS